MEDSSFQMILRRKNILNYLRYEMIPVDILLQSLITNLYFLIAFLISFKTLI
jgi:hypothetical protein